MMIPSSCKQSFLAKYETPSPGNKNGGITTLEEISIFKDGVTL